MKKMIICLLNVLLLIAFQQVKAQHNYAELLQKSIYFYDAQRSGTMPSYGYNPGQNRVRWMSNQHTYDGYDLVLPGGSMINGHGQTITDANKAGALQGGFRDAGDNPKWSQSITFAVNGLAWSGIEYRNQLLSTGQMPYLMANVKWGTDYLLRCFLSTNPDDPATYKIVLVVSDYRAEQQVATSSELHPHRNPQRPHFYADKDAPMTATVANIASALATSSVLFRQNGDIAYADKLLQASKRIYNFCQAYWGYGFYKRADGTIRQKTSVFSDSYFANYAPGFSNSNLPKTITQAYNKQAGGADYITEPSDVNSQTFLHSPQSLQANLGNYDYDNSRSAAGLIRNLSDNLAFAAIWLNQAEKAAGRTGDQYLSDAVSLAEIMSTDLSSTGPYWNATRTDGSAASGGGAFPFGFHQVFDYRIPVALLLNRLVQTETKYKQWLEQALDNQINRGTTPGGMALLAGEKNWGPIEQISPAIFIQLLYSQEVKDPTKKNRYENFGKKQIAYFLGANPENRCYVIGYKPGGVISTNIGLHANALGSNGGFDDYNPTKTSFPNGKPSNSASGITESRNGAGENRNMLYGGIIGGPSTGTGGDAPADKYANTDGSSITTISTRAQRSEVATFYQPYWTGAMAHMVKENGGSPLPADFAKEGLPDGEDIPDPIPANSKWAREEFFNEAKIEATATATVNTLRIRVNNKSRWPQRIIDKASFRYYFTLEPGVNVSQIDLLNPYSAITATCPPDADGATLSNSTEGLVTKSSPTHGVAGSDVVVVSTDAAGNRLCYIEVYFKKPSLTTYNYLFDNPSSVTNGRYAWRVVKDPLAAAQKMLTDGAVWNPVPGSIPADGRTDFEVIAPWGVYNSKNIGFAGNFTTRQAVVRLTFSGTNNIANDWSYANLVSGSNASPAPAMNIPVYNDGQLLSGDVPEQPGQVPGAPPVAAAPVHDYKKALQRALYYFETQRSGNLTTGVKLPGGTQLPNRVNWRGNAHHVTSTQGGDLFPDINLVGGLYSAGDDYLKSSWTMSAAGSLLAWSTLEFPSAFDGQKDHLLGTLKYINDYFLQSIVYGSESDVTSYKIHLMVTDRKAAAVAPNNYLLRHQKWASAEVMHEFDNNDPEKPVRRYFYADKDAPSVTMVSAMAASLAASSKVFRNEGDAENIAYADKLLAASRNLYNFVLYFTHGAGKMLNYTGQNFNTRTLGSLGGYNGANGANINGVMKDATGALVRHDPYLYPANTTIFTSSGSRPAAIAGANGILGSGSSPAVTRMNFNSTQPVGTGADYDAPVPDYHEMPDDYLTNASTVSRYLHDDLCWAALWLNQAETDATAAATRLNEAISFFSAFQTDINATGTSQGNSSGFHWYRVPAAIVLHKLKAALPAGSSVSYATRIENYAGANASAPATNTLLANAAANGGFINTTNNRMQRPGGSATPNLFACMNLLAYANVMSTETPAPTGSRLDLQNKFIEVGRRNIDGMLGTNSNNRSFMIGYDSQNIPGLSGVNGITVNHNRTALGYFAGIGHRTTGSNSNYRLNARHTQDGGIVSGPQATYNGSYTRENVLSTASTDWAFESNETSIVTNAFAVFGLGYLVKDGSGSLSEDFPKQVQKDDEVFVEAGIVSNNSTATTIRATINNRSLWPAKAYNDLRFRYYFTLEDGAGITSQTITGHDASAAPTISSPVLVSGNTYYVEIAFTDKIFPGGEDNVSGRSNAYTPTGTLPNVPMHFRRTVVFQLNHTSSFVDDNDWSFAGLPVISSSVRPIKSKQIPVYDGSTKLFGNEPGNFDFELWVDENEDGVINSADYRVNGNSTAVDFGSTTPGAPVQKQFIARNTTPAAITINPLWQLPAGFSRVAEGAITVPADNGVTVLQLRFDASTLCAQSGDVVFNTNASNPLENPFKFFVKGYVGYAGVTVLDGVQPLQNESVINMGTTLQGNSVTKVITIQNEGCEPLTLSNFSITSGFTLLNAFPNTVAAGETVALEVRASACEQGVQSGVISFATNDPQRSTVSLQLQAEVQEQNLLANAGEDQTVCLGNSVTLHAAALPSGNPTFTGQWTIVNGTGTFADANNPQTTFTPTSGPGAYLLKWTINNGLCVSSNDQVTINILPNKQPTADDITNLTIPFNASAQAVNITGISIGDCEVGQQISITATSSNPALIIPFVSYSSLSSTGTISFTPAANTAGTAVITVRIKDDGGTQNGGVDEIIKTFTVTVNKGEQVITFHPLADVLYQSNPLLSFELTGTTTSGLPISYSVIGPVTLTGNLLTVTGIGPVTVTAAQPGDDNYLAAASITRTFNVTTTEMEKGVKPIVECVTNNGNGTYTAWFGYKNDMGMPVFIPVGATNYMTPASQNGVQPQSFQASNSGRFQKVFSIVFPSTGTVSWSLAGPDGKLRTATATASSTVCPLTTSAASKSTSSFVQLEVERKMQVYPNPAASRVTIKIPLLQSNNARIWIVDSYGRPLQEHKLQKGQSTIEIIVNRLSSGRYFVKLTDGGERYLEPLVIIN